MKTKEKKKILDKSSWLTTRAQRSRYYISDLGRTCEGAIITTFMTMFLLMQGLDPAKMAGIMLAVKIVDSLDDVIFGFLIDRLHLDNLKKFKKYLGEGKYLPWFRLTFWMFPIFTILFFQMPQTIPEWGKLIWFGVFYLLYDLTYTLVEVPMNSLAVTITDNVEERNVIIQNRQILNNSVIMVIGILFYALVSEKVGLPIKWVVVGASVIFFAMMLPMTRGVKEYNTELKNVDEEENARYSFRDMIDCVKTNKYIFVLLLSSVVTSCLATGANLANFVAYYHFGDSMIFVIPIAISIIPGLIAQLSTAKLTKKFGKIPVILFAGVMGGVPLLSMYFVGTKHVVLLCGLLVIQSLPGNVSNIAKSFLIPDTIEYTRYKTGKDCSGIFFALNSFTTKLSQSIASSLGLFMLGLSGWVEITADSFEDIVAQGVQQPESALNMLWVVYALIPAIGALAGVLVMFLYRMKDKDVELMAKCNAGEITREECEAQLSRKY